jgi:hypothetical protein
MEIQRIQDLNVRKNANLNEQRIQRYQTFACI